jgi:hypothetical protein
MFLTRHFVFVHVPKTGGNFVREILENHAPEEWELQGLEAHATYHEIPASHRDLPRLAFARNPFAWHVSWFHFQKGVRDKFFLHISEGGELDFADSMHRAYTGDGPLAKQSGALTQTLFDMLGDGLEGAKVGKMESLRDDLLRMIGECTAVPPDMARAIQQVTPKNTSKHRHYSSYYDPALRDLIRSKDAPVFDYFGYDWEEPPASS